jgi:YidC/Oxa1 family membrane protein insertase
MEKRVFAAIFLSFIVLVVYQNYFAPPVPVPAATPAPAPVTGSQAAATTPGPTTSPAGPPAAAAPVEAARPAVEVVAPDARDIVVETDAVRAVFTTQGAVLKSWKLRKYHDARGEPLELVPQDLPAGQFPRPFAIATDDPALTATLASAVYDPSVESLTLGAQPGTITFQFRNDAGLTARKAFYFQPNGQAYVLNLDASVDQGGTPRPVTIAFGPAIALGYDPSGATRWPEKAVHHLNGSVDRLDADDLRAQPRYEGAIRFAGVEEHYFLIAAVPAQVPQSRVEYAPVTLPVPGAPAGTQRTFISFAITPNPSSASGQPVTVPFFLGPKDFDQLKMADTQLVRAIDFGMFAAIVVPLLRALKWINGFLGNYGWSIIALTVLINLLLFPLRHRSMVSMKKMQAIQPEVKAIQDRFAKYKFNDPERQKMNAEMLKLYKDKGVNPVAGCLPMALTFPILLALYSLLSVAIELRGAPFIGWIHDLASKDPTYVWPILMGATMFWQQKMMPTNADPIQQKIFLLLPVIFTVMFLSMPSGLVIYWLTSNLLTIAQQYATNRLVAAPVRSTAPRKG